MISVLTLQGIDTIMCYSEIRIEKYRTNHRENRETYRESHRESQYISQYTLREALYRAPIREQHRTP